MRADGDVAIYPPGSNGNVPPMARIVGRRYVVKVFLTIGYIDLSDYHFTEAATFTR